MRTRLPALALVMALLVWTCQAVSDDDVQVEPSVTQASVKALPSSTVTTGGATPAESHEPIWVTVRYRSDPVDVAYPGRFDVMVPDSTVVTAAAFDPANRYLLVALNGVWYHYCGVTDSVWASFGASTSKGRFYNSELRGSYDCRSGGVPDYS